jgi:hypothetical protein
MPFHHSYGFCRLPSLGEMISIIENWEDFLVILIYASQGWEILQLPMGVESAGTAEEPWSDVKERDDCASWNDEGRFFNHPGVGKASHRVMQGEHEHIFLNTDAEPGGSSRNENFSRTTHNHDRESDNLNRKDSLWGTWGQTLDADIHRWEYMWGGPET